jgi:hypothetical protein
MLFFFFIMRVIYSQVNVTSYANYPQYFNSSVNMFDSNLVSNGS